MPNEDQDRPDHEDREYRNQEPLVVQDNASPPTGHEPKPDPSPAEPMSPEDFARVLKEVLKPGLPSHARSEPMWNSVPGLKDFTTGVSARGNSPSSETTPDDKPGFDLNAVRPELGNLLADDPGRRSHEPEVSPVAGLDSASGARLGPRTDGDGVWNLDRNGTNQAGPSGDFLPRTQPPSTTRPGLDVNYANPGSGGGSIQNSTASHSGLDALMTLAVTESRCSPDATSPGIDSEVTNRPHDSFSLPAVNPITDQLATASPFTGAEDTSAEISPYSFDLPESSASPSAFGPVLLGAVDTGVVGAGNPGVSGGLEGVGHSFSTLDAWSSQASPDGSGPSTGSSLDPSKTNDLLQQILDELRKGRQPYLPINDRNSSI